ncbi:uncharacterized protein LOC127250614 [Andrographis paniculata]|uniref:uncharacterized protein LOC127250614 n=1 Tax=Andrographis paniculata TaxID=175694 RepID=UPI0021E943CE|nr:uncharacterized protein LOC127250614 [Andrographis paniculata]
MSIVPRTHDCYEHYELKAFEKLFSCDGCKMKGFGQRYQCNLCGNELHKECKSPKATITHEFFARSTFTFREKPFTRYGFNHQREFSKICDACGKEIRGFSYHCEEDNLDVHPYCLNLEKNVLISKDTVFNLEANVVSKCIWCKKKKISDDSRGVLGWSYISTCRKYHFHVYCMAEMAHEACVRSGGEMVLENVELRSLAKKRSRRKMVVVEMIKSILKIVFAALLGDPTVLISSAIVELLSRGLS